jgi:hypothetical protein
MRATTDRGTLLRSEVGQFRARESRRVFDTVVHLGRLGGPRDSFVVRAQDLPALDPALCTDVVSSMVEQSPPEWCTVWLSRAGVPQLHDVDQLWHAAAGVAFGIHGRLLEGFYVLTRSGWLDVRTGESKVWKRLRL